MTEGIKSYGEYVLAQNPAGHCSASDVECAFLKQGCTRPVSAPSCLGREPVIFVKPEEFLVLRLKGLT